MIKFVHAADLHLGSRFAFAGPRKAAVLEKNLARSFNGLIDYCNRVEADILLLSGDIYDSPSPAPYWKELFRRGIERLNTAKAFGTLGNHDFGLDGEPVKNLHLFATDPESVYLPGLRLWVHGRSFPSMNPGAITNGFTLGEGYNLLCIHGNLGGKDYNPIALEELSGFDYAALGHKHQFSKRGEKICYSGCIMGRGFDELGEKGFVSGELDERGLRIEFVPSGAPVFEEIDLYPEDYSNEYEMIDLCRRRLLEKNLYRIVPHGVYMSERQVFEELKDSAFYIEVRREDDAEAEGLFYDLLREELKDDPEALRTALMALSGRDIP